MDGKETKMLVEKEKKKREREKCVILSINRHVHLKIQMMERLKYTIWLYYVKEFRIVMEVSLTIHPKMMMKIRVRREICSCSFIFLL